MKKAWRKGIAAERAGKNLSACPYAKDSPQLNDWHRGFIESMIEQTAVGKTKRKLPRWGR